MQTPLSLSFPSSNSNGPLSGEPPPGKSFVLGPCNPTSRIR